MIAPTPFRSPPATSRSPSQNPADSGRPETLISDTVSDAKSRCTPERELPLAHGERLSRNRRCRVPLNRPSEDSTPCIRGWGSAAHVNETEFSARMPADDREQLARRDVACLSTSSLCTSSDLGDLMCSMPGSFMSGPTCFESGVLSFT